MASVYRSGPVPFDAGSPAVLVVHCSDPRYRPHFQEFLQRGLKLDRHAIIAVPGGPQCLTLAGYLPKFSWAGWRWTKFMKNLMQPARIVLIAHDDCRWYIENRFVPHGLEAREHQIRDMHQARAELMERFPKVAIELYYAALDGERGHFERI
jgi:hypothetical protein